MRVPDFRRSAGQTSPEVLAQDVADYTRRLATLLGGAVDPPAIDSSGAKSKGNMRMGMGRQTFKESDVDVFVAHDLGLACNEWVPLSPSDYAQFRKGTKPPTANGCWIQSNTPGVTAEFLFMK